MYYELPLYLIYLFLDRNLTHIVDIIYVSDHGMTDTSAQRVAYLDDIIGEKGINDIIHEDGEQSSSQRCLI
jgi:predicted AlkP superfamily pyrophosphatase or phosphodiesterase